MRKADKLQRDLGKQKAELEEKVKKLSALKFACEPDARAALERLKRESASPFHSVSGDVEAEEVILKRERPGRPRKGEATPTKTVYKVKAQVGALNEEAYAEAKLRASCFVLITNIDDTKKFPPERVLRKYKEQTSIVVILPDGTRALVESRLFPDKMFKALGISPTVYLSTLQENAGP